MPPSPSPVPVKTSQQTIRDNIIAGAQSAEDLYQQASILDPQLAKALQGKATGGSLTPLGAALGGLATGLSAHYALGWDPQFCQFVGGLGAVGVGYAVHWWQSWMAKPLLDGLGSK